MNMRGYFKPPGRHKVTNTYFFYTFKESHEFTQQKGLLQLVVVKRESQLIDEILYFSRMRWVNDA